MSMVRVERSGSDVYESKSIRRLAAFMILEAYWDVRGESSYLKKINSPVKVSAEQKKARRWFEDENEEIWSFGWCCEVVGMSRKVIRDKVFGHVAEMEDA